MDYVILIVLVTLAGCNGCQLEQGPVDSAVTVGDTIEMICITSNSDTSPPQWVIANIVSDELIFVSSAKGETAEYTLNEYTDEQGFHVFNLQVDAKDRTVGGTFTCQCGNNGAGYLTVLDAPKCESVFDGAVLVAGASVTLECTVVYANDEMDSPPVQTIKNYDEFGTPMTTPANETVTDDPTNKINVGYSTFETTWQDNGQEYYCISSVHDNYEDNCTYTLDVQHSAENFSLVPYYSDLVYYHGEYITANVSANPDAKQYVWTNINTAEVLDEDSAKTIQIPNTWNGNTTLDIEVTNEVNGVEARKVFTISIDVRACCRNGANNRIIMEIRSLMICLLITALLMLLTSC